MARRSLLLHGFIELNNLDGVLFLELCFHDGVNEDMQEGIHLGFRFVFMISGKVGELKPVIKFILMLQHDLAQAPLLR